MRSLGLLGPLLVGCSQGQGLFAAAIPAHPEVRNVNISPDDLVYKPTIKTVLIIDNSRSMADEQAALARGLSNLVASIKKYKEVNLEFYVYTTSATNTATAAEKATHFAETSFLAGTGAGGAMVPLADTTALPSASLIQADVLKTIKLSLAPPLVPSIKLVGSMSASEMDLVGASISSAVTSVGIDGSDDELGLCAIARMLVEDDSKNALFAQEGDKVAFIIISDDDDYSTAATCSRFNEQKKYAFKAGSSTPRSSIEVAASGPDDAQYWKYQATFKGSPGTDSNQVSFSYVSSANFVVHAKFNNPRYNVSINYVNSVATNKVSVNYYSSETYNVSMAYKKVNCSYDGQMFPCDPADVGPFTVTLPFDSSLVGGAFPTPGTNVACSSTLQNWAMGAASLVAGDVSITGCQYSVTAPISTAKVDFNPASLGINPPATSATTDCPASLLQYAQTNVIPPGKRMVPATCKYEFTAASINTKSLTLAGTDSHLAGTNQGVNQVCPSTLETYMGTQLGGKTPVPNTCVYSYAPNIVVGGSISKSVADFDSLYGIHVSETDGKKTGVDCSSNSALVALAASIAPGAGQTLVAGSCTYDYLPNIAWQTLTVDPSAYEQTPGVSGACSSALRDFANSKVPADSPFPSKVSGCSFNYIPGAAAPVSTCNFTDSAAQVARDLCSLNGGTDLATILQAAPANCTGGSPAGRTYQPTSCVRSGYKMQPQNPIDVPDSWAAPVDLGPVSVLDLIVPGLTDFNFGIVSEARKKFGEKGFFVAAIINDEGLPQTGCTDGARAGFGKKYHMLTKILGEQGFVHPICNSDYSPAMDKVQDFVLRTLKSSYRIPLEFNETISKVLVIRGSSQLEPIPDQDYFVKGGTVDFVEGYIKSGDQLSFEVTKMVGARK